MVDGSTASVKASRPLTGRTVFIWILGFFGTVGLVNAVMIRAAVSSFTGVEVQNPYQAGLAFGQEIAAAQAQEARHWRVNAAIAPAGENAVSVDLTARDGDARPLTGLEVTAQLAHPVDKRFDHTFALREVGPGLFRGSTSSAPGSWDLVVDISRRGERLFRSRNRVSLR